jgi:protein ImuA
VETGAQSSSPDVLSPGSLPALQPGSILSELFPALPRDAGWTGFVLQHLRTPKPLLWVQERMAILEAGRVHAAGLGPLGPNLIHVEARDAKAALWAMEEGLRCSALGGVIGELWGDPQALDFTATRRLAVAAERSGVACWLIRLQGAANLSGARERWRLASAPSAPHAFDLKAPGAPRWSAELFRSRRRSPGNWIIPLPLRERDSVRSTQGEGALFGIRPLSPTPLPQGKRGYDGAADLLPVAAQPPDRALGGRQRRA